MTPTANLTSGAASRADAGEQAAPQAAGPFVLNLCSSTTPMALPKSEQPELKRFSFFVSRRFEEGRERFRLHMGYFATLAEAEEWLGAVRDIYPGAWAGEAPGKKLRERAVAAAAAQAKHAAGPPPAPVTAPHSVPTVPAAARGTAAIPVIKAAAPQAQMPQIEVPTLHAATVVSSRPAAPQPFAANVNRSVPATKPGPAAGLPPAAQASGAPRVPAARPASGPNATITPRATAPGTGPQLKTTVSVKPAPVSAGAPARPLNTVRSSPGAVARTVSPGAMAPQVKVPGQTASPQTRGVAQPRNSAPAPGSGPTRTVPPSRPNIRPGSKPVLPDSNVREVLAALSETIEESTGETRMMPAPAIPAPDATDDAVFTDTQVLKFLEARRTQGNESTGVDVETGAISLLKPDDTGTRRALKQAVTENAPVWFAVQLQWSVQPVELVKVPPLAIFSAYTLYTVEGSRDGRKWYGLRLGFFSDAISAKQVAYYVRSEFTSVAVVPVSPQERTRASDADRKGDAKLAFPKKTRSGPVEEFKLIDSDEHAGVPTVGAARPASRPASASRTASTAPNAAKRNPKGGSRVRAREHRGPQTLEETLEILGAGELEIDNGSGETLNESGVRHLRVEVQKNTPFSRLLERLSERVRKP